jgi:hypothetical protein
MNRRVPDLRKLQALTGFRPATRLRTVIDDVITEKKAEPPT